MRRMIMWQACICVMLMFMSMNAGLTDEEALDSAQIQEILKRDRGGVVRGVHFKMQTEDISSVEGKTNCLGIENGRLNYAIKKSASSTHSRIDVSYGFESETLNNITVISVQKDIDSAIRLYRNLKEEFDMAYGEGRSSQNGTTTWGGVDEQNSITYYVDCELQDSAVVIKYRAI